MTRDTNRMAAGTGLRTLTLALVIGLAGLALVPAAQAAAPSALSAIATEETAEPAGVDVDEPDVDAPGAEDLPAKARDEVERLLTGSADHSGYEDRECWRNEDGTKTCCWYEEEDDDHRTCQDYEWRCYERQGWKHCRWYQSGNRYCEPYYAKKHDRYDG